MNAQGASGPMRVPSAIRCRASMQRFERIRNRFSAVAVTLALVATMTTVICMTTHLLD